MSSVVGANSALVFVRAQAIGAVLDIGFKDTTEALNVGRTALNDYGGGVTAGTCNDGNIVYLWIRTNSSGVLRVRKLNSGVNYSLDILAYIK